MLIEKTKSIAKEFVHCKLGSKKTKVILLLTFYTTSFTLLLEELLMCRFETKIIYYLG